MLPAVRAQLEQGEAELKKNEPALLEAKAQIDAGREQLDAVKAQLEQGESQLKAAMSQLAAMRAGLSDTEQKLKDEKEELLASFDKISGMQTSVGEYEQLQADYKNARQALLAYDEISDKLVGGAELFDAAHELARSMRAGYILRFALRIVMNVLMLAAAVFGIMSLLQVFEKLGYSLPLWKTAALCALCALLAEIISISLGRGLLYTALFALVFAAVQSALCYEKKQQARDAV